MTQLAANGLKEAASVRNVWTVTPEFGIPHEALLKDGYWAHVSAKLRPGDHIEVLAIDGSYFAELLVLDAGKLYAKVRSLRHVKLDAVEVPESELMVEGLEAKWQGPVLKWCVLRGPDRLKEGMDKASAIQWMKNHAKVAA
jgi:hypothetical protein